MQLKPREIWEKGTPLSEAWYAFSNEVLRQKLDDQIEYGHQPGSETGDFLSSLTALAKALQQVRVGPADKAKLIDEMKNDLLTWLQEEELFAYGFPVRPASARTPRRIGSEFWAGPKIVWDDCMAGDALYSFQRIRIVDPGEFPEITLKPKVGRKTHGDLIGYHAYLLFKRYPEYLDLTNKEKIRAVRKSIQKENPDLDLSGKGFGDDAMRKHIKTVEAEYENFLNSK